MVMTGGAVVYTLGKYVCIFAGYRAHLLTRLGAREVCVCKNRRGDDQVSFYGVRPY